MRPALLVVSTSKNRGVARGFTLVELLTVVAITGVLATIGTMLVRHHFQAAKMAEGAAVIQAIRVAEEGHRTENGLYLNCSTSPTGWYPAKPDNKRRSWTFASHADYVRWRQLDIDRPEGTQFGFLVNAGLPNAAQPTLATKAGITWNVPVEPWFVIQAAADRDVDSTYALMVATSFNGELFVENELE